MIKDMIMILLGIIFDKHKTKKMFEKEGYTDQEYREFIKGGKPIQSRNDERIMYQLTKGQIHIVEKEIVLWSIYILNFLDMEQIKTKICTKCGNEKPATTEFFHKRGLGLSYYCKPCCNDYYKRYRKNNPEYKKRV